MKQITISIVRGVLRPGFYDGVLKIFTLFLLVSTLPANRAAAQEPGQAFKLYAGQALPDSLLNAELRVLGAGDSGALKLADFKGKPFIIDFWASWCGSCIKSLPHVDSIFKANGVALGLVLVNISARDRDAEKLARFIDSFLKHHEGFSVPFLAQNELFARYFHIQTLPCYVWVGGDGRIKAISGYGTFTDQNVSRFLKGGAIVIKDGRL
ncbi:TlpA disulfide reductase family protein [Pedobacter sp. D749]|uniref:TlpA family protein disulfide reductase n=1 Tax=Pedobacter sp. D749 TaxID=2856523 RepID=UPI001C57EA21|nr:TlpA disulfide reductase family protein [Pedobacter sp. D749]QXU41452.1 TlpA family protein disulfide reductase [Pedobacter sp. D749]